MCFKVTYEHGLHVPLIMTGPGIPAGETRDAFCYLLDIYPTLCDLVGIPFPHTMEGKSLVPARRNAGERVRDMLLFAYKDVQRYARDERYKLIEYVVGGERATQLFDLHEDPWELSNLAGDPGSAPHLNRLRGELLRWRDELGDTQSALGEPCWRG